MQDAIWHNLHQLDFQSSLGDRYSFFCVIMVRHYEQTDITNEHEQCMIVLPLMIHQYVPLFSSLYDADI